MVRKCPDGVIPYGGWWWQNAGVTELFALTLLWGVFLWYIATAPKEKMQMTWLVLVGLTLAAPVLAMIWPALR